MSISNSQFREFAVASTAKPPSPFRHVVTAIAILVPAVGIYLWRSGTVDRWLAPKPQMMVAAKAVTTPVASTPSTVPAAAPAHRGNGEPHDAYAMALRMQMNMDVIMEYTGEMMDQFNLGGDKVKRWISSDHLVAYCKQIARIHTNGRSSRFDGDSKMMFNLMGERIYCLFTTRPEKLCDAETKDEVVRQYVVYHKVKHGALSALMLDPNTQRMAGALNTGPHKSIKDELKKLGQRGYLASGDFGWFPPADVKEVFADIKDVKSACKA